MSARRVRLSLTNASIRIMLWAARVDAVRKVESMIAIILISFLALIGALTIYFRKRTPKDAANNLVAPAPQFEGLFDCPGEPLLLENQQTLASRKRELLELARDGELNVLAEAHAAHDPQLYDDVLNALSEWGSERQENLAALVSHISKSDQLRASKQLARRFIESWQTAPDRRSTTALLHIAALSDDAETYEQAVEEVIRLWQSGKLSGFRPDELVDLFISQYWLIAPEARRGGVGFALQRRLLSVRRELATATPAS